MGRRKIEIKAIKDDRNRSVTFLKRKGGLFKKAYELSVLCSADVAIVIFGNNKKLYEFSSTQIEDILDRRQYFGAPHERKGPDDYINKGGNSEGEDDDDEATDMNGMRQSNSPPMHNRANSLGYNMAVPMPGRHLTPGPGPHSRPISRNAPHPHQRHMSGGAIIGPNGQPIHPGIGGQPNGFNFVNQFNPAVTQAQVATIPPGYSYTQNGPHPNSAQVFMQQQQQQENMLRRQSMPSSLPQQQPPQHQHEQQVPPHIIPDQQHVPQHQPQIQVANDQPMLTGEEEDEMVEDPPASDGITRLRTKSRSIFTPIAGDSSLLAQHWFGPDRSPIRANSIDVGAMARKNAVGEPLIKKEPNGSVSEDDPKALPLIRTSTGEIGPPTRTPSMISTPGGGLKRPVLKVQIPNDEEEDANTNTGGTSPQNSGLTADPVSARPHEPLPPGAVLPPPSPSVGNSAPLSAGGSGPPNPFARPPPTSAANNLLDQTPISALPSRFVENMLPSPSAFFSSDWATGGLRGDDNLLPSPLNFKTPTIGRLYDDDNTASKRKSPDSMDVDSGSTTTTKRVKT
ncbi:hypothetical protein TWF106_007310 [Orbilia oligospora]|uniref:MADS-box domain-containing protein n=1 Tax=Orbilia oligospora TaxID=2813651 RepID=A0A6G1MCK5_ORBOL|nr:hypothetical protein TWF788_004836 [Orbilia oligospora]KAF3206431.1 hypothetical protein TWF679_008737 [Orbilia oligospora]KAF3218785.1 hypothetical protein TWF106_007310 [Orbilia oligospora]KAF3230628.1 hypothetical protein TWF191_009539 [Orbilia oligospora]KAF3254009.1 hypothetical protein TWF192_003523 [Orbilia oligospora]